MTPRKPAFPDLQPEDVDEAAVFYQEGWTLTQIAHKFEVTRPTVAKALKKLDIVIRPPGGVR